MASSTTPTNNQSNVLVNETAVQHYMRQCVDYLDDGIDLPELSQIRQLDISLQDYYRRVRELAENLRVKVDDQQEQSQSHLETQTMLINMLIQAKMIGDQKMQLSQQMLDTTQQQSKSLKLAHQKYVQSINQQTSLSDDIDSENEYDSETTSSRGLLPAKALTTSLWKRKATTTGTVTLKRKYITNSEQNEKSISNERDRRKLTPRSINSNTQNNNSGNGRRLRLNNDSSTTQSDETTYCLCSQFSYGSMILCDSKACDIKWFHFNCVNLTTKPKGKWFCPNCREN